MGAIDPTYFIWGNKRYVIWKEDGNAVGKPTPININQLSDDGLFLSSPLLIFNSLIYYYLNY